MRLAGVSGGPSVGLQAMADRDRDHHELSKRAPVSEEWARHRRYGVVIDAGSSGSRIQVYSWIDHAIARQRRIARGDAIGVLPKIEKGVEHGEGWTLKVEPGISSLGPNPQGVDAYLAPLFDHARSIIPASELANTPVYLLATAGMRLIPAAQSEAVLQGACRYIRDSTPFRMSDCEDQVRIISGEEEGVYGWVAINYLMDGFDAHGLADKGKGRHSSTYGFLDMGGASTQIAFEPSTEARKEHADNLLSVNLRLLDGVDVHHPVFVTTWLGYGTNQARERYVDATLTQYLAHHPPDVQASASVGSEKPTVAISDPCLPKNLLLTESRHPGYALHGTGDFPACMQKAAPLLNKELPCPDEPCLMGVHVPPIDFSVNHFIGISEYWYSTQDIWNLGGVYDFPTFEKSALTYCSQNWDEIVRDHSEGGSRWQAGQKPPDLHRLEMQCFKAAWIVNVLHDGIGIPRMSLDAGGDGGRGNGTEDALVKAGQKGFAKAPSSFQSVNEINDVAVSWTLGRMVLEVTDSIPRSSAKSSQAHAHELEDALTPTFEWRAGHARDSWRHRISNALRRTSATSSPLALVAVVLVAVALYYFCWKTRRRSFFSGSPKPAREDYGLVSMEEGDHDDDYPGSGPDDSAAASPRKILNPLAKTILPFRIFASRAVTYMNQQKPLVSGSSTFSLPTTRPNSPTRRMTGHPHTQPSRPGTLKHAVSSPALFRGSPPQAKHTVFTSSAPTSRANLHLDLAGTGMDQGAPPPLTPPVRQGAAPWHLRMTASPGRSPGGGDGRKSKRRTHTSTTSNSDSEGYLSVPVGLSSTAPSLSTGSAWSANTGSANGNGRPVPDGTGSGSSDDGKPGLRSRNSSYTNLGALARQRGGHSRQATLESA